MISKIATAAHTCIGLQNAEKQLQSSWNGLWLSSPSTDAHNSYL